MISECYLNLNQIDPNLPERKGTIYYCLTKTQWENLWQSLPAKLKRVLANKKKLSIVVIE